MIFGGGGSGGTGGTGGTGGSSAHTRLPLLRPRGAVVWGASTQGERPRALTLGYDCIAPTGRPASHQGHQGIQGIQYLQGFQSYQCLQCLQCLQGFQSYQGFQGFQSYQGIQGLLTCHFYQSIGTGR